MGLSCAGCEAWLCLLRPRSSPAGQRAGIGGTGPAWGMYFAPPEFQDEWNAGDLGCGDLLLPLPGSLRQMSPGQVLLLTASDAYAPQDIPAYCALTGHRPEGMSHPRY